MAKNQLVTQEDAPPPVPALENYALTVHGAENVLDILRENVAEGLTQQSLERIKVPSGGAEVWEVINPLTGKKEYEPEIEGVILAHVKQRVYWRENYEDSNGAPPDCSSPDSHIGRGDPGGRCMQCPLSQFGTARKGDKILRGQACQQRYVLFLLRPGSLLPTVVSAPPTSIRQVEGYMLRLAGAAKRHYGVVTLLGLEGDKNKDGTAFAKILPRFGKELTPEEMRQIEPIKEMIKRATATTVDVDNFERVDEDGVVHTGGGAAARDAEREAAY